MENAVRRNGARHVCAVGRCRSSPELSYHRFPRDAARQKAWISFCRRADRITVTSARICSQHFSPDSYERDLRHELLGLPLRKLLKEDAVPTLRKAPASASGHVEEVKPEPGDDYDELIEGGAVAGPEPGTVVSHSRDERYHKRETGKLVAALLAGELLPERKDVAINCDIVKGYEVVNLRRLLVSERAKVCRLKARVKRLEMVLRKTEGAAPPNENDILHSGRS